MNFICFSIFDSMDVILEFLEVTFELISVNYKMNSVLKGGNKCNVLTWKFYGGNLGHDVRRCAEIL